MITFRHFWITPFRFADFCSTGIERDFGGREAREKISPAIAEVFVMTNTNFI